MAWCCSTASTSPISTWGESLEVVTRPLISRDGTGEALRLPLRWIAILRDRIQADLAATGGVHSAEDVVKLLMVGADVTMMASTLLLHGVERLQRIRQDLVTWLEARDTSRWHNCGAA
jgi:dihydroorotate dehydrogenase (fumarate)